MENTNPKAAQAEVMRLIAGYTNSQLVYLAAKLGIADLLADRAQAFAEIAGSLAVNPQILRHVLRGFVVIGLLQQHEDGTFALTALGACLRTGVPGEFRERAMIVGELYYPAWSGLDRMLQTGESAFESIFHQSVYDYMQEHPATMTRLQTQLQNGMRTNATELLAAYDFTDIHTIVDVGGGMGVGLAAILQAYPQVSGTLFDLPSVVAEATPLLDQQGLTGRYQAIAGDFFEAIPTGGDLYLLSRVLHNWNDEQCVQILRNCQLAKHGDQNY